MAPPIRLIPLDTIVVDPERKPVPGLRAGACLRGELDLHPSLILTPDHRLMAGRACLDAYRQDGQRAVRCLIAEPGDIDMLLTSIHNRILFGELAEAELDLQLDRYAELCWFRQIRGAAETLPPQPDAGRGDLPEDPHELPDAVPDSPEWEYPDSGPEGLPIGGRYWLRRFRQFPP